MKLRATAGKRALVPLPTGIIFHGSRFCVRKSRRNTRQTSWLLGHPPSGVSIFCSKIGTHSQEFQVGIIRPHRVPNFAPQSFFWKNNLGGFRKIRKLEHYYIV